MNERRVLPEGMTPRLLSREAAATYCGISPNHFDETVAKEVLAIHIGRRALWDIKELDRWVDRRGGASDDADPPRSIAERLNGNQSARH